jgi:hypothetical protein
MTNVSVKKLLPPQSRLQNVVKDILYDIIYFSTYKRLQAYFY